MSVKMNFGGSGTYTERDFRISPTQENNPLTNLSHLLQLEYEQDDKPPTKG